MGWTMPDYDVRVLTGVLKDTPVNRRFMAAAMGWEESGKLSWPPAPAGSVSELCQHCGSEMWLTADMQEERVRVAGTQGCWVLCMLCAAYKVSAMELRGGDVTVEVLGDDDGRAAP
jgi:hypothetical protein